MISAPSSLKQVKDMSIKFIIDEIQKCHQRISVLEIEISEMKLKEQQYHENIALISKKNLYQKIINSVSQTVNNSIELGDPTEYTVDILSKNILRVNCVAIYFVVDDLSALNAQRGNNKNYLEQFKNIPHETSFNWKIFSESKPSYLSNDENILSLGKEMGIKSYISTPILFNYKQIGTLTINSLFSNAFDEEEVNLLNSLANQISIAIYHSKFNEIENVNYHSIS